MLSKVNKDQVWWHMPVIPATQEIEIRKITVWGQPRNRGGQFVRPYLKKKTRRVAPSKWEVEIEGLHRQKDPLQNITKTERVGGMLKW
jgi:hypothetical protein